MVNGLEWFTREMQMRAVSLVVIATVAFLMGMQKGVNMVEMNAWDYAQTFCNQRSPDYRFVINGSGNMTGYDWNGSRFTSVGGGYG